MVSRGAAALGTSQSSGGYAYVGCSWFRKRRSGRLVVLDVSNPPAPREVGFADTGVDLPEGVAAAGGSVVVYV